MGVSERVGLNRNEAMAYSWFILAFVSIGLALTAFWISLTPFKWNDYLFLLSLTIAWNPYSYIGLLVVVVISFCVGYRYVRRIDFGEAETENP